MSSPDKKSFLLRIDPAVWQELERIAAADLRSVNAQIEFLLREALEFLPHGRIDPQQERFLVRAAHARILGPTARSMAAIRRRGSSQPSSVRLPFARVTSTASPVATL